MHQQTPLPLERARGCFLGLAIGDALGAPLEGLSPQQIRSHYHRVVDYVDGTKAWRKKPFRWRLPGLYTDDTQQALVLADVLLEHGRIEPEQVAELYLRLATPKGTFMGAHRGIGRSFRYVLTELEQGTPPHESGQTSAGIGAAMRIAPVGLYYASEPQDIPEAVIAASLMTHRDIRSLAGAMAVAFAVRRLAMNDSRAGSLVFRVAADVAAAEKLLAREVPGVLGASTYSQSLSKAIAKVEAYLDIPKEKALAALVEEANQHGPEAPCKKPTQGFPPACIPTCLYLLLSTQSFEQALIEVINLGGDTDSAGAILGAMAGAHYGVDAIPGHWLDGLQNREGIEQRAIALARSSAEGLEIPDLIETERRLSHEEAACRDRLLAT